MKVVIISLLCFVGCSVIVIISVIGDSVTEIDYESLMQLYYAYDKCIELRIA